MTGLFGHSARKVWLLLAALVFVLVGCGLHSSPIASAASSSSCGYDAEVVCRTASPSFAGRADNWRDTSERSKEFVVAESMLSLAATSKTSLRFVATKPGASTLDDVLMPGGSPLGAKGTDVAIREVAGGLTDAQAMFKQLSQGGKIVQQTPTITRVELPNGGFVQIRTTMSKSPKTVATIDVNIPGYDIDKIKFNP